ncbi:hydroxyacid dehydrogenase [Streptomyces sp. cg28]|uniref:hydroxyacid dehydrogenase n=1 Tax=Streptomyces sp. cg28 TaxID=3403457 RepID=UPI003B216C97
MGGPRTAGIRPRRRGQLPERQDTMTPPPRSAPPAADARPTVPVAFAMPESTFRRVFRPDDVAALHGSGTVELLADRPLDPADPADRGLLAQAEVLITGWGTAPLDAARLDLLPSLRGLVHSAGTVRPVVDDAVWARGIAVTSSAAANAVPVAEYTVAMIVLAAKRAFTAADRLRGGAGSVDLEADWPDVGAHGITVGLVGASRVGRAVIERLRAYDVDIVVADPHLDDLEAARLGVRHVELPELFATSGVVSLHAPLLAGTRHMIDRTLIERLRPGATFINTARGGLVDQEALADRLDRGDIAAVLDVTDPEHLPADARLRHTPHTFITPHIAGSVGNELGRLAHNAVRETVAFTTTGTFLDPITHQQFTIQA